MIDTGQENRRISMQRVSGASGQLTEWKLLHGRTRLHDGVCESVEFLLEPGHIVIGESMLRVLEPCRPSASIEVSDQPLPHPPGIVLQDRHGGRAPPGQELSAGTDEVLALRGRVTCFIRRPFPALEAILRM